MNTQQYSQTFIKLPLNNPSKGIVAFLGSCSFVTMPSYVGEIFNANKTGESVKFLENSLHKKNIPLTLEHVGLDYHLGYGKAEDIDKNIVKIGNVDEIYKKNNSYYAKVTFTGNKDPRLINKSKKWYLSASDDRDNVFEVGLTQDPRRDVSPLEKMSSPAVNKPLEGVQRLMQMNLEHSEKELKKANNSPSNVEVKPEDITPKMLELMESYKKRLAKEAKDEYEEKMKDMKEQLTRMKSSKDLSTKVLGELWNIEPVRALTDGLEQYCLDQVRNNPAISRTLVRSCNGENPMYNDMEQTGILGMVEEIRKQSTKTVDSNNDNAPPRKKSKVDDRLSLAKELTMQLKDY